MTWSGWSGVHGFACRRGSVTGGRGLVVGLGLEGPQPQAVGDHRPSRAGAFISAPDRGVAGLVDRRDYRSIVDRLLTGHGQLPGLGTDLHPGHARNLRDLGSHRSLAVFAGHPGHLVSVRSHLVLLLTGTFNGLNYIPSGGIPYREYALTRGERGARRPLGGR